MGVVRYRRAEPSRQLKRCGEGLDKICLFWAAYRRNTKIRTSLILIWMCHVNDFWWYWPLEGHGNVVGIFTPTRTLTHGPLIIRWQGMVKFSKNPANIGHNFHVLVQYVRTKSGIWDFVRMPHLASGLQNRVRKLRISEEKKKKKRKKHYFNYFTKCYVLGVYSIRAAAHSSIRVSDAVEMVMWERVR